MVKRPSLSSLLVYSPGFFVICSMPLQVSGDLSRFLIEKIRIIRYASYLSHSDIGKLMLGKERQPKYFIASRYFKLTTSSPAFPGRLKYSGTSLQLAS